MPQVDARESRPSMEKAGSTARPLLIPRVGKGIYMVTSRVFCVGGCQALPPYLCAFRRQVRDEGMIGFQAATSSIVMSRYPPSMVLYLTDKRGVYSSPQTPDPMARTQCSAGQERG